MPVTAKDLLAAADAVVPRIPAAQAIDLAKSGNVLFLDVRDGTELAASGKVAGALHISRGSLESRACRESPTHVAALSAADTIIVYCAGGGRAAMAGKTLKDMGYGDVRNFGGFKDWVAAGGPVEKI